MATANNDVVSGGSDSNYLRRLGGNDSLNGNGGDDFLEGGGGNDQLNGGAGKRDTLKVGAGVTVIDAFWRKAA